MSNAIPAGQVASTSTEKRTSRLLTIDRDREFSMLDTQLEKPNPRLCSFVDQDRRSLALKSIDWSEVALVHMLKQDEASIDLYDKMYRIRQTGAVRLDAAVGVALLKDHHSFKAESILEMLNRERDVTSIELPGTIMKAPVEEMREMVSEEQRKGADTRTFIFRLVRNRGDWNWRWAIACQDGGKSTINHVAAIIEEGRAGYQRPLL